MDNKDEVIAQLLSDYKTNEETIGVLRADLKKLSYELGALASALADSPSTIDVLPDALNLYGEYGERPTIPNTRLQARYIGERITEFKALIDRKTQMRDCLKQMGFDSILKE